MPASRMYIGQQYLTRSRLLSFPWLFLPFKQDGDLEGVLQYLRNYDEWSAKVLAREPCTGETVLFVFRARQPRNIYIYICA